MLLLSQSQTATACDPNCDFVSFFVQATPLAVGTVVLAPLLGLAADSKPDSPYWQALGFTFLTTGASWAIGIAKTSPSGEQVDDVSGLATLPALIGVTTTILVYVFWPRSQNTDSARLWHNGPSLSFLPIEGGGVVGLRWNF